jgi:SAM-dependent methyltransferase
MPTWNELYAQGVAPIEPLPWVERCMPALRDAHVERALDLGCGTGRHLTLLGRQGFSLCGMDIAPNGIEVSRRRIEDEGRSAMLVLAGMQDLPFAGGSFDAVLSIHVLYHATRAGMLRSMDEIARVLRPGGLFVGTLLSTRTWKYGEGEMLEPETFVQPRGPEAGVPHHYCDESESRSLLSGFELLDLHLDEFADEAGERQSHWEFLAQRA